MNKFIFSIFFSCSALAFNFPVEHPFSSGEPASIQDIDGDWYLVLSDTRYPITITGYSSNLNTISFTYQFGNDTLYFTEKVEDFPLIFMDYSSDICSPQISDDEL